VKALQAVALEEDYDDPIANPDGFFGDERDVIYGFELNLQGGGHQHVCYLAGWRIKYFWFTLNGDSWCTHYEWPCYLDADCDEREGHQHTVKVWREYDVDNQTDSASDSSKTWRYHLRDCRFGALSDWQQFEYPDDWTVHDDQGDAVCADHHNLLLR